MLEREGEGGQKCCDGAPETETGYRGAVSALWPSGFWVGLLLHWDTGTPVDVWTGWASEEGARCNGRV